MRLPPFSFAVLDTETTGFIPRVNHVMEFASMRCEKGEVTDTYETLIAVPDQIPPHVQVLTRIKQENLVNQPTFGEKLNEIESKLAGVEILVGQNLSFDIGMLKGEGLDLSTRPWVDTSMLASVVFPEFRSFSLQYMSTVLHLNHAPAHRALGDVRATLELFGKIWERLLELPPEELAYAKDVMGKSTEGYKIFFDALPASTSKKATWILPILRKEVKPKQGNLTLKIPEAGTVSLHEEGLHCDYLQDIINAAAADTSVTHWIAVKNLESSLKRIHTPSGVTVIHPPQLLLNPETIEPLRAQTAYLVEEATLLLKLKWFTPRTRNDIALHGNEKDVWNGKLACTAISSAYVDQFAKKSSAFLLDHRQLLSFLNDPTHAAHGALTKDAHIIVDDASMLEDTATKAYGHYSSADDMRSAAGSDPELMHFSNVFSLLLEKLRSNEDQYFVTPADLRKPEAIAVRTLADELQKRSALPEKTRELLRAVHNLLEQNLPMEHIIWIERRMDGTLTLQSAPERVDSILQKNLYDRYRTTLLAPYGMHGKLPEIVPQGMKYSLEENTNLGTCPLTVNFPRDITVTSFLQNPQGGKTIILAGSKRVIEQHYIANEERLEEQGVTLVCQGLSGGQGRMESEFIAAESPAILIVTPFMYEGLDFPSGTADRLILDTVPFDHPNQPVIAKRRTHFGNAFTEYNMPRVECRLFRLMRTFCRHRKEEGEMTVLDKRLFEKDYGARLQNYMTQFGLPKGPKIEPPREPATQSKQSEKKPKTTAKTPVKAKKEPKTKADGQMQLPL